MAGKSESVSWWGLALTATLAIITGSAYVVRIDSRLSSLDDRFKVVEQTINEIAPRKVKVAAQMPVPAPTRPIAASTAASSPEAEASALQGPALDWRDRFVLDHCQRCPSCCATTLPEVAR